MSTSSFPSGDRCLAAHIFTEMAQPGIRRRAAIRLRRILHLDQIEAAARRLDDRLGGLEARETQVDAALNAVHTRLEGLDSRLESLDAELGRRHADQMGMLLAIAAEDAENRRRLWRARETEH